MTLPIVLAAIALKLTTDTLLDFIYPESFGDATLPTTPIPAEPPYQPPFLGGQCAIGYMVSYTIKRTRVDGSVTTENRTYPFALQGAILGSRTVKTGLTASNGYQTIGVYIERSVGSVGVVGESSIPSGTGYIDWVLTITSVVPENPSLPDNCGNAPNPNPTTPPSIPSGGAPQNQTPAITPSDRLVEGGLPVVFTPSILAALVSLAAEIGAAIANAQAAADALSAAKALATAVGKLADMLEAQKDILERLRKELNKKEREDEAKKKYLLRQFGTLIGDGYLDITPRPAPEGFTPLMLDFLCADVPNGLGRFFGKFSYNWFRYQELGHICFLSPTSGVLSIHKIEHVRTSIAIPELAIGFTYNMGLNRAIRARASMIYTQEKTS